jgi:hypothetical protein
VAKKATYACIYRKLGCPSREEYSMDAVIGHHEKCLYRPSECLFHTLGSNCEWKGFEQDIRPHLTSHHKVDFCQVEMEGKMTGWHGESGWYSIVLPFGACVNRVKCYEMLEDERLGFCCVCTVKDDRLYTCIFCIYRATAHKYRYKVQIIARDGTVASQGYVTCSYINSMEDLIKGEYIVFKRDFAMKCLDANKNLTLKVHMKSLQ